MWASMKFLPLSVVILLSPSLTEAVKQRVFGWEKHQTRPFTGGNNVIVIVIVPAILRQKTQTARRNRSRIIFPNLTTF